MGVIHADLGALTTAQRLRITVVMSGVNNGSCDKTGYFGIKVRTEAAKFGNVSITGFRQC